MTDTPHTIPANGTAPVGLVDDNLSTHLQLAPARARATSKRDALLRCAREHFAAHGYFGTPIAAVAQSVRIRKSTFFHYFEDKDALYDAAVRAVLDELADSAIKASARGSFEERLNALVEATATFLHGEASLPRLLLRAVVDEPSQATVRPTALDRLTTTFAETIQRGVDEGRVAPCDPVSEAIAMVTFIASQVATTSALTLPLQKGEPSTEKLQARARALLPQP